MIGPFKIIIVWLAWILEYIKQNKANSVSIYLSKFFTQALSNHSCLLYKPFECRITWLTCMCWQQHESQEKKTIVKTKGTIACIRCVKQEILIHIYIYTVYTPRIALFKLSATCSRYSLLSRWNIGDFSGSSYASRAIKSYMEGSHLLPKLQGN